MEQDCERDSGLLVSTLEKKIKDYRVRIKHKSNKNLVPWITSDILTQIRKTDLALNMKLNQRQQ